MRTIGRLLCLALLAGPLAVSYSYAETTRAKVVVSANENALITIEQGDGILKLVQFCPDLLKKGCGENIIVKRNGNSFQLDKEAVGYHQKAFNLVFDTGKWLKIPDESHVTLAGNFLKIEPGENGDYFVYVGPVPAR